MFSLFAKPLGQLMQWIYTIIPSYFWALIIFTVLTRLILFPLSIKNQKSQADRARLAPRLERIQKKYGQDRQKMMMKQQELYEKEGVKMTGGCLPMLVQMLVLFSIIAVIYKPLTYIHSVPQEQIDACISVAQDNLDPKDVKEQARYERLDQPTYNELYLFDEINDTTRPQMELALVNQELGDKKDLSAKIEAAMTKKVADAKAEAKVNGVSFDEKKFKKENKAAVEAEVTKAFYKDNAKLFDKAADVVTTIEKTGEEFSVFGISLLDVPKDEGIRPNWLWLIVLASGLSAFLSGQLSMKYSKAAMSMEQQQAAGCSNAMMYMMPLMSLIFSFTVPAGVAVYWTFSNLLAMVQTVILNAMWNPAKIRAQAEAEYAERRRKRREDKERLKAARLAEQAAWQEEENKARARAKGDITQKKAAASTATPAELPQETVDHIPEDTVDDTVEEE